MSNALFIKLPDQLMIVLVVILLIVLPSVYTNELMQGAVSGKMFFFLYAILISGILLAVKIAFKTYSCMHFSIIDVLLLVWFVYILINGFIKQMPVSGRLLELFGLVVFYIVLRRIKPSNYGILLMAMLIGGIIQALYGNLQLWGFFPSHHSLFRITGSFFNPGPFAGYLAGVFPAVLGMCLFKIRPLPVMDENLNHIINVTGKRVSGKFKTVQWPIVSRMACFALMVILLILIPSQSRASWMAAVVSSIMLLMVRYPVMNWIKKHSLHWKNRLKPNIRISLRGI